MSQVTVSTSGLSARTTLSGRHRALLLVKLVSCSSECFESAASGTAVRRGATKSRVSVPCRQQLLPYNEFGNAEVLSRRQLSRRLGQYRRRARAEERFLDDPADAHASAAKQWLVQRSRCDAVWIMLDEPDSSRVAWWIALLLRLFVVASIVIMFLQVGDETSLMDLTTAAVLETVIDSVFFLEFLCRVLSAPSKKTYILDLYNWADILSASGLVLRSSMGFVPAPSPSPEENVVQALLSYVLPVVRLLKLLRYMADAAGVYLPMCFFVGRL